MAVLPPETKVPSIPNPASDPEGFMRAVTEIVQVREGSRGNPLDRAVTFRDLVDAGLAAPNRALAGKGRIPASALITPTGAGGAGGAVGTGIKPTLTVPPRPRGVSAVGTFGVILIAWAEPDYANHSYAEILRADTDDIGQAVVIGSSVGGQYPDSVGETADKYYWVRFVSTSNVKGPASVSVRGKTALSPEFVMANLLAQVWQPNTAYSLFQYIKPAVDNGLMYRVNQEGISGATEPTWPTGVGQVVTDGTVRWITVSADERVPFIIGTVNGEPAVVIDNAYIGDATITVAKIKEAFLDNLTAIHGTLHFARIEHGNIFELTIGGEIRSLVYSPFNNTGFIIRNEPGRDPDTPTLREYTAEFYGDTLFSGDIRAARVLGGMIVGSVFGVPSDADNGSYEFISLRDVVSDITYGERSDPRMDHTVTSEEGQADIQIVSLPLPTAFRYVNVSQPAPFTTTIRASGANDANEFLPSIGPIIADQFGGYRTSPISYNPFDNGEFRAARDKMYFVSPYPAQALPIPGLFLRMYPVYRGGAAGVGNHVAAKFKSSTAAKVVTNALNIISYNANAPRNYQRYRHKNISATVTFTRPGNFGVGSNSVVLFQYDWNDAGRIQIGFPIRATRFSICHNDIEIRSLIIAQSVIDVNGNFRTTPETSFHASSAGSIRHDVYFLRQTSVDVSELIVNDAEFDMRLRIVHTAGGFSVVDHTTSYIRFKKVAFESTIPTGISLKVVNINGYVDVTSASDYRAANFGTYYSGAVNKHYGLSGLDIGVAFSSAMDNTV